MKTIEELEAEISKLRIKLYWLEREYNSYKEQKTKEFQELIQKISEKDEWYSTSQPFSYKNYDGWE